MSESFRWGAFFAMVSLSILGQMGVAAEADFSKDEYATEPQVIARIASAAQKFGAPLRSSSDGRTAYYLRSAEYVGPCKAPFGLVHVARLFFIRSSVRGSMYPPSRGHTFIVFLDRKFVIRTFWLVDFDLGRLTVSGSRLLLNEGLLFDYRDPPGNDLVEVNGTVQGVPRWKRTAPKSRQRSAKTENGSARFVGTLVAEANDTVIEQAALRRGSLGL